MFQQTKQLLKIVKKTIEVMFDQRKFVGTKKGQMFEQLVVRRGPHFFSSVCRSIPERFA